MKVAYTLLVVVLTVIFMVLFKHGFVYLKAKRVSQTECLSRKINQAKISEDEHIAIERNREAAAYNEKGDASYNGKGTPVDYGVAAHWYRKAADLGFPVAQNNLALMYYQGKGMPANLIEAAFWLEKASVAGNMNAQYYLSLCYKNGKGTPKDLEKAYYWCQKSADQGYYLAQYLLACCYYNGWGVTKNLAEWSKWCKLAAEQGYTIAQTALGECYEYGNKGVEQNYYEAAKWYSKAADQDCAYAQFNLGCLYKNGYGVEKSNIKALTLYLASAEQGYNEAQRQIIYMSINRTNNPETFDPFMAYKWYLVYRKNNQEPFFDLFMIKPTSDAELREAEAWAANWKPRVHE